jgi:uncharacterized protein YqgC (DUF456 family)
MSETQTITPPQQSEMFCVNHPTVATGLRCNKCGNPICVKCAVRTPVGYRCKTCVKTQQAAFYTATSADYIVAAVITLPFAAIGQFIGPMLWFFAIFAGPLVGGLVGELVYRANGKRRGQYTWLVVGACFIVGAMPALAFALLSFNLINLGLNGIYLVLAVGSAVARLRFGK